MKVQVLTTPQCSNCKILEELLDKFGISYEIVDITEKPEYLEKYPIFTAPGLVIDGKLEFTGIPRMEELKKKINNTENVFYYHSNNERK